MQLQPSAIYKEYESGVAFKSSLGTHGMYEQNKINERFFSGDQWYTASKTGNRPLVRHNVIKRIGDYKMAQLLNGSIGIDYSAQGIPADYNSDESKKLESNVLSQHGYKFAGRVDDNEINLIMTMFGKYRDYVAKQSKFDILCEKALKKAYISGSAVIYTYWDALADTGLFADSERTVKIKGDIKSEVVDIENVYFADTENDDVQSQKYIIIATESDVDSVVAQSRAFGADEHTVSLIINSAQNGKVLTLTKLYKETDIFGDTRVMCTKVTENAVIRPPFDTKLHIYPLSLFKWNERNGMIYGDSDVTYLIPNQIAINRMITANVWSAVTMGMPIMVVNGDTVTDTVTNDPGQIIKIYGTNEDVEGAVKYVTPPDFSKNFGESIESLISQTLAQSGANEVALGDSMPDNAAALTVMLNAATLPLQLVKKRFLAFLEDVAKIWAEFWICNYKNRLLRLETKDGVRYITFDGERYKNLIITANAKVITENEISTEKKAQILSELYGQGVINKEKYVAEMPQSIIKTDGETEGDLK